jgi:hypothetical protein
MKLTMFAFDGVVGHMKKLGTIAKSKGLSRAALLRLLISDYIRTEGAVATEVNDYHI